MAYWPSTTPTTSCVHEPNNRVALLTVSHCSGRSRPVKAPPREAV
jgi:hypothetical protein